MYKKMKKTVIVNIYNFIRMSHIEPSVFIQDDFETVKNQITLIRQYGFPATYALKYDALTDSRYQELLKTCQVYKEICMSQLSREEAENHEA